MIDSALISVSPLADAIAELHIRDGNQKKGNCNCHENDVSHVLGSSQGCNSCRINSSDNGVRSGTRVLAISPKK
jgi:hypothetical protein